MANLSYKRTLLNPATASSTFADTTKITFGFMAHRISIHYKSGTNAVEFSTNGSDSFDVVGPAAGDKQSVELTEPSTEIWYKGASGDEVISIIAQSHH